MLTHHKVGIADVMFDHAPSKDDHTRVHRPHSVIVQSTDIWIIYVIDTYSLTSPGPRVCGEGSGNHCTSISQLYHKTWYLVTRSSLEKREPRYGAIPRLTSYSDPIFRAEGYILALPTHLHVTHAI